MTTTQTATETSQTILSAIYQARAVMRSVELAAEAQEDGAVDYEDNGAERWGPAVDFATQRIALVRDLVINASPAPVCAWYTPLAMLEALGAALWRGNSQSDGAMGLDELQTAAQACVEALEDLAGECATVH